MTTSVPEVTATSDPRLAAPDSSEIGRLVRLGVVWTLLLTSGNQLVNVITTMVLSRILLPSDYGTMGMVATLTALLAAVSGMGLSWATVQRRDLTMVQVHNLFWLNAAAGVVLWGAAVAGAPILADFYDQGDVAEVTRVLGVSFAISGLAVQPMALLQRRMQFRLSTIVELVALALGAIAAIVLAKNGGGYWALVANGLVTQSVQLVLAFVVSGYLPGWPRRDPATLSMLTFGGYLTLASVVTYLSRNTDHILVGREWGPEALGYYSRAYFLMTLPTMLITGSLARVMVPSLSALAHDRDRMAAAYEKSVSSIAFVGYPVAIGLAVTAPEAVRLIYGPGWEPVVPILAWFSVAMVSQVVTSTNGWLYTATGNGRALFLVGIGVTAILLVAFFIGAQFEPSAVAAAYAISSGVVTIPLMAIAHRVAGIPIRPTLRRIAPLLLASSVMGAVAFGAGAIASWLWDTWQATLVAKVALGGGTFVGLSFAFIDPWPVPWLDRVRRRRQSTGPASRGAL